MDMKTSTTEKVKVEMHFAPDVLVAMQMVGLHGDRLEQEMKKATAIDLFRRGLLSTGKAAELAGICLADFMDLLLAHDVPVVEYTIEEYEKDMKAFERLDK
jgi:predicted HTH domain antitoxin